MSNWVKYAAGGACAALLAGTVRADRAVDFGQQWIRNNPFTITALPATYETPALAAAGNDGRQAFDPNLYFQTNYTTLTTTYTNPGTEGFQLAASNPAHRTHHRTLNYPYADASFRAVIDGYAQADGLVAWQLFDEPPAELFPYIRDMANYLKTTYPDKLIYETVLPGSFYSYANPQPPNYPYFQYLNDFMDTVNPDVIMVDWYPYWNNNEPPNFYHMFWAQMQVREDALERNKPYWGWVQAHGAPSYYLRAPSESEVRLQVYAQLAMGYTGLSYYTHDPYGPNDGGVLNWNGTPSPVQPWAADVNAEVQNLGVTLRFLRSTSVTYLASYHVNSGGFLEQNVSPPYVDDWVPGSGGDTRLIEAGVRINGPEDYGINRNGLLGTFIGDDGDTYFMLTSMLFASPGSNADTSIEFRLFFDSTVNQLLRLNPETGAPESISLTNNQLIVTLTNGSGELFKYKTGNNFLGILDGDADLDGDVDLSDLSTLASFYGVGSGAGWLKGDFDLDGDVDLNDLSTLAAHYGAGEAQAMADFATLIAIPEPAIGLLSAAGLGCYIARRR